jgi:hypothetical protein
MGVTDVGVAVMDEIECIDLGHGRELSIYLIDYLTNN